MNKVSLLMNKISLLRKPLRNMRNNERKTDKMR